MDASSVEPQLHSPAPLRLCCVSPAPTTNDAPVTTSTSQDPLFRARSALSVVYTHTVVMWLPVLPACVPPFANRGETHPALKAPSPANKEGRVRGTWSPNGSAWHVTGAPVGPPPSPYAPHPGCSLRPTLRRPTELREGRVEHAQSGSNVELHRPSACACPPCAAPGTSGRHMRESALPPSYWARGTHGRRRSLWLNTHLASSCSVSCCCVEGEQLLKVRTPEPSARLHSVHRTSAAPTYSAA